MSRPLTEHTGGVDSDAAEDADVVIYGATLAGIMAALRLRMRGYRSVVLEPSAHVGGIVAGGLVKSDYPATLGAVGGLTLRRFFYGIADEYAVPHEAFYTDPDRAYRFEPKVAERVARRLLDDAEAEVHLNSRIHGRDDVDVVGGRIRGVRGPAGWLRAEFFIDASYEGDLLAAAGVPYTAGRESTETYGESFAGFRPQTAFRRAGYRPNTGYPIRQPRTGAPGEADGLVQAYNFRGVLTTATDRLPFPRPEGYDPRHYVHFRQQLEQRGATGLSSIVTHTALLPPGDKYQTNQGWFIGFDLPGASWDYPDGSWHTRDEIVAEHVRWHQGMLYFLANDPSLSETFRADTQRFGLPNDEFGDSPFGMGFPHALYIRESRRMLGQTVLTQHHVEGTETSVTTPVACYQYPIDCHIVQYYPEDDDTIVGEGPLVASMDNPPAALYQVPAEALIPADGGIENMCVPVCLSASHVAMLSVRMEPAFGMLGEAAGELAAQALRRNTPVQKYDYPELAVALSEHDAVLTLDDHDAGATS